MIGEIGILNVGAGDTKLSFDPSKPDEVKRSARIVKDMLMRGYAIFVEVGKNEKGPIYQRATDFDAETSEYLIVGTPPEPENENAEPKRTSRPESRKATRGQTRVPAAKTNAVAVARTAGG
jgi:hypothetical protein